MKLSGSDRICQKRLRVVHASLGNQRNLPKALASGPFANIDVNVRRRQGIDTVRRNLYGVGNVDRQTWQRKGFAKSMDVSGVALRSSISSSVSMDGIDADELLSVAEEVADAAQKITSRYFRARTLPVDTKSDSSPVSIADKEAEIQMRAVIKERYPNHAIFGEEQGFSCGHGGQSDFMWVVDPIDGTKSFITGKPVFGTLVAVLQDGKPILGIIDQPILKERWIGIRGRPSNLNGETISTRTCPSVKDAYLYATTPHMFSGSDEEAFNRVRDSVRIPLYGCDCYAYGLLAAGHCDLVVEADLKPYDYLALVPIVEGAGGKITNWRGEPLTWSVKEAASGKAPSAEVIASGDAKCHAEALQLLDWK